MNGQMTGWRLGGIQYVALLGFGTSNSDEAGLPSQNKMCKGKPVVTLHIN